MMIKGIDFTSKPTRKKPITCVVCDYENNKLNMVDYQLLTSFSEFETLLSDKSKWFAGLDFPFGLARKFIENIGWENDWKSYVAYVSTLSREEFVKALEDYKSNRTSGDKEHRRQTDILAKSISPQKLYGVPVGKMFFEGATRLISAPVAVLPFELNKSANPVIEAYPALIARRCIGNRSYKNDIRSRQTNELAQARSELLNQLEQGILNEEYGFTLDIQEFKDILLGDASGDLLDAFLCTIQAAWVYTMREHNFGIPAEVDLLEGWIPDPALL